MHGDRHDDLQVHAAVITQHRRLWTWVRERTDVGDTLQERMLIEVMTQVNPEHKHWRGALYQQPLSNLMSVQMQFKLNQIIFGKSSCLL